MLAAELALPHRLKRGPFTETTLYEGELQERLENIAESYDESEASELPSSPDAAAEAEKKVSG